MKWSAKAASSILIGSAFLPLAQRASAAVITLSDTAPTSSVLSNPYSAATVGTQTNYIDYTDNPSSNSAPDGTGQTFVIPSAGLTINSITVKVGGGLGNSLATSNYYVDIQSIDGNSVSNIYRTYDGGTSYQRAKLTSIDKEAATGGALIAAAATAGDTTEYITFTLNTPVVLSGATQTAYNFSISTSTAYVGLALNNFAFQSGNDDAVGLETYNDGTSSLGLDQNNNAASKVFYINASFAAVPEPTSCGLLLVSGLAMLGRRKSNLG